MSIERDISELRDDFEYYLIGINQEIPYVFSVRDELVSFLLKNTV